MKTLFFRILVMLVIGLSLAFTAMSADAYRCAWRNGHRVCWHNNVRHCYWVGGYWRHGIYYGGHKVCS